MRTVEQKVSRTVLQKTQTVLVGNKEYRVAPPTLATLIMVSEQVSKLPHIELDNDDGLKSVLHYAKDCRFLGDIAAVLILGAKYIKDGGKSAQSEEKRYLWGLVKIKRKPITKEQLAEDILNTLSPSEILKLVTDILGDMQIADFFALTTFLLEANLLRVTKVD